MSRLKEALEILQHTSESHTISAARFAEKFWPGHLMHVQVTNTGNGACSGKKAWLCGGSYLAKLANKGYVSNFGLRGYYMRPKGKEKLKELETQKPITLSLWPYR